MSTPRRAGFFSVATDVALLAYFHSDLKQISSFGVHSRHLLGQVSIIVLMSLATQSCSQLDQPIRTYRGEVTTNTAVLPQLRVTYLHGFGKKGDGDGEFWGPFGVHVAATGEVLVADDLGHTIQVFDSQGKFLRRIGKHGTSPGEFAYLDCVITDSSGLVYVADTGNNRIQVLESGGKPRRELRSWGVFTGFRNPRSLSIGPGGQLWVADWGNHCVKSFDSDFRFRGQIGRKGGKSGEFNHPVFVLHDSDGKLYVSDSGNHRVQVFDDRGAVSLVLGQPGTGPGQLRHPHGIAFDRVGRLYISDHGNNRIQIMTTKGQFLKEFGRFGSGPGEFDKPCGTAIDSQSRLFVVDQGNHRVQVFQID